MKKTQKTSFPFPSSNLLVGIVLSVIVFTAAVLRFYNVQTLPAVLNRDEAALAYNAFLLNETGKDEWGRSWPITLESFGDYKLPGYPFILVGVFKVLGYTDFAVRLPSVIAGVILVVLGFLFARKVFLCSKGSSLWVAGTIALQPVFFFYSRMAWEANVGLMFFVSGALFLLFSRKKIPTTLTEYLVSDTVGLLLLLLAIFTYNTPLLLLPFLAIAVALQRGVKQWKKYSFTLIALGILFIAGIGLFSSVSQQKSGITIFSDETLWQQSVNYYQSFSGVAQKVVGNRFVFFGKEMVSRYIQSLNPQFLVWKGGQHPWHNLPGYSHLFLATYLLFIIGVLRTLWQFFSKKVTPQTRQNYAAVLFLLLTSLLPAIITVDAPHATRSLFFFFLVCILSGRGIEFIWQEVSLRTAQKNAAQVFFVLLLTTGLYLEVHRYYFTYFTRYTKQSAEILQAELAPILDSVETMTDLNKDQVAVVDPNGFLYVSVAWYLKMSPQTFFETINHHLPDRIGLKYGYRVGRYRFIIRREDRVAEDKHIIEWNPDYSKWVID